MKYEWESKLEIRDSESFLFSGEKNMIMDSWQLRIEKAGEGF